VKDNVVITRAEAKERGLKRYFTGKPCPKGHVSVRRTYNSACVACIHEATASKRPEAYQRNRPKRIAKIKEWQEANPEKTKEIRRFATIKIKYKIDRKQWSALFEGQGRKCAICGIDETKIKGFWTTDHCHTSNKVRGILCHKCNAGLGQFNDEESIVLSALNYLRKHKNEQ
jgi:hypothetical protein